MRKLLRKAKISQILSKTDIHLLERDYETEAMILRNCHDILSVKYHGMYENPEELEDVLNVKISELTQQFENYTMGEDTFTGDPVLYRKIQKKRIDLILTFAYRNQTKSLPFSIDVEEGMVARIREGIKVWAVLIKNDDEFIVEKIQL